MDIESTPPARPRFASEVRTTAVLAAPLVAGHVASGLIGFVDSVIAGHHGTATLASVSVGTALFWLPMMIPMGTLMSLPPAVSELDGAGRRHEVGALFRQGLWLAAMLGVLLFGFLTAIVYALEPMGIAAEIRPGATAFLHGIRWGVPGFTLYLTMRYLSDGLHWTLPTMLLGFGGLLVLVPLGYAMTYGVGGLPGFSIPELEPADWAMRPRS
jgi:MATE family multidrug resistance protein